MGCRNMAKTRDRWPELCERVAEVDGLPVYPIKPHTEEKLWFWHRYIDAVSTAMVGNPKWQGGVSYLDLYSGPGVCELERPRKRLPGSPLIAAMASKPLSMIACCDSNASNAKACDERLARLGKGDRYVIPGDANERIDELISSIPSRSLTLAFVDPFAFDLVFETLGSIAKGCRADFLILFADGVDLIRNIRHVYQDPQADRVDRFLGDEAWRTVYAGMDDHSGEAVGKVFRQFFRDRLRERLGYKHFRERPIGSGSTRYYTLVFASRHELGANIWDRVTKKDHRGQDSLF
mgnify:CR=1 FL=1